MTTKKTSTRNARAELQTWYLQGLLPKLARASGSGAADQRAVDAFDREMRAFLDLARGRQEAA